METADKAKVVEKDEFNLIFQIDRGKTARNLIHFFSLFVPRIKVGPLSVPDFLLYVQNLVGCRDSTAAATAARCATNELNTSLKKYCPQTDATTFTFASVSILLL